jgi:hypothetical protein
MKSYLDRALTLLQLEPKQEVACAAMIKERVKILCKAHRHQAGILSLKMLDALQGVHSTKSPQANPGDRPH